MQPPFNDDFREIAEGMGISLYQRFTLNEASLFLRCPISDLEDLVEAGEIEYIQISKSEVQLFGYQLLQHLLNGISGNFSSKPSSEPTEQQDRILRVNEVQQIVGLSRSTIWRLERKGGFPDRVPLGTGSIGWLKSDINTWMQNRK